MTHRSASLARHRSLVAAVAVVLVAGCASRPLNAPPVEDWSGSAAASRPSAASPSAATALYTVRRDDTLASIARRYNTTSADLAALNHLAVPVVRPDQVIRVPVPAAAASSNAPLKTGPLGIRRPYSDATLAELSKPDEASTPAPPAVAGGPSATPGATAPAGDVAWTWPVAGKPSTRFGGASKGVDIPGKAGDPVLAAADGKVSFVGSGVRGYGNFVIIRHSPDLLSVYANNRANLVKEGAVVAKGQKIAEMGNSESDAVRLHFEIRNDSKPVDPLKYLPER